MSRKILDPRTDYDVIGAAERLGLHPRTVSRWLQEGVIEGYRLGPGGKYHVTEGAIQKFLSGRQARSALRRAQTTSSPQKARTKRLARS